MGENTNYNLEYVIPEKIYDRLLDNDELDMFMDFDFGKENCHRQADGTVLITIEDHPNWQEYEFEEMLLSHEIPYDSSWGSDDGTDDGYSEVRFEIDKQTGIAECRKVFENDNDKMQIDPIIVLNAINENNIEKAKKLLTDCIDDYTSETKMEQAHIPSEERLLFLLAQSNEVEVVKSLYKKGIDIKYRDLKTNKTTLDVIAQCGNTELASMIKKDLLKKNQNTVRQQYSDDGMSL